MVSVKADAASSTATYRQGSAIVLAGTIIWASTGVFISYLLKHYTIAPLSLAFWRDFLTALILFASLLILKPALLRVPRRDVLFLIAYGVFGLASFNAIWTYSVAFNGAAVSTVLLYTAPAFVAVISRWLFDEPLWWNKILAIVLAVTGCALVAQVYDFDFILANPIGTVIGLVSGLGFAVYSLFGKAASRRGLNPWTTTLFTFMTGSVVLFLIQPFGQLWSIGPAADGWLLLLALAAGPTLGGYGLYMVGLGYLPVSSASIIVALEPVFTAIMAFVFLGELMTGVQVIGGVLIFVGVLALQLRRLEKITHHKGHKEKPVINR